MLNIGGGLYICISLEICKYAKYAKYRGGLYICISHEICIYIEGGAY